jgi:hypothetical protein
MTPTLCCSLIVRDIASPNSKFFLKSEYARFGNRWPALSYTRPQVKAYLDKHYRQGFDFVLYAGTQGRETRDSADRGCLLSAVQIDLSKARPSAMVIPQESWAEAQASNPGQWEYSLGVVKAWDFITRPRTRDVLPVTYPIMGHPHNRGMVREIAESERDSVLALPVDELQIPKQAWLADALTREELFRNTALSGEAIRIAELIFNRVSASGTLQMRTAPMRLAPTDFLLRVAEMLRQEPLMCALCGGQMPLRPSNKLLKVSPDRKDSRSGSYGPENFQLSHLACNLAKNNATEEEFREWLTIASQGVLDLAD